MTSRFAALVLLICPLSIFAGQYRQLTFEGVKYQIYTVKPSRLELHWKFPKTNRPFRRFGKLQEYLADQKRKVVFMMNAGIFEPDSSPTGLHVQNGKVLKPLNLKNGEGNFFLKPNGVFFINDKKAAIVESSQYATLDITPKLALQSGPTLLLDGKIHPKFNPKSENHRHRNGIGIDASGQVVFAISETGQKKYPTLYDFAKLFAKLGCRNALFLDGDLSFMVVNPKGRIIRKNNFGAILAVTAPIDQRVKPTPVPKQKLSGESSPR